MLLLKITLIIILSLTVSVLGGLYLPEVLAIILSLAIGLGMGYMISRTCQDHFKKIYNLPD